MTHAGGDTTGSARPIRALTDPRFLCAIALLALNDHVLKQTWPSWWTGKLSDVAGMAAFPVVVATLVDGSARLHGRATPRSTKPLALLIAGGLLVAIKTSPTAAAAAEATLASLTGRDQRIVVDPTDLLGLTGLLVAWPILTKPRPLVADRVISRAVLGISLLACVATSEVPPPAFTQIEERDNTLIANSPGWNSSVWVSGDGGRTWVERVAGEEYDRIEPRLAGCLEREPNRCFRIDAERVLETTDGGTTWRVAWFIDDSEPWVGRQLTDETHQVQVEPLDLVVTEEDVVVVAVGSIAPIHRDLDGQWTPTPVELRSFPGGWVFLAMGLLLLGVGLIAFVRLSARYAGVALIGIGGALTVAGFPLMLDDNSFDALAAFAIALFVGGCIAALAAIVKGFTWATRDHQPRKPPGRVSRLVWTDPAAIALAIVVSALPHVAWNLGVVGWDTATGLLVVVVGLGLLLQTLSLATMSAGPTIIEPSAASGSGEPRRVNPWPTPLFLGIALMISTAAFVTIRFLIGVALLMVLAGLVRRQGLHGTFWKARVSVVLAVGLGAFVASFLYDSPVSPAALAAIVVSWIVLLVPLDQAPSDQARR